MKPDNKYWPRPIVRIPEERNFGLQIRIEKEPRQVWEAYHC